MNSDINYTHARQRVADLHRAAARGRLAATLGRPTKNPRFAPRPKQAV